MLEPNTDDGLVAAVQPSRGLVERPFAAASLPTLGRIVVKTTISQSFDPVDPTKAWVRDMLEPNTDGGLVAAV